MVQTISLPLPGYGFAGDMAHKANGGLKAQMEKITPEQRNIQPSGRMRPAIAFVATNQIIICKCNSLNEFKFRRIVDGSSRLVDGVLCLRTYLRLVII